MSKAIANKIIKRSETWLFHGAHAGEIIRLAPKLAKAYLKLKIKCEALEKAKGVGKS